MVAGLRNVDEQLASQVAQGLGIELPEALPRVLAKPAKPEVTSSPGLSLMARPGDDSIRTRCIAVIVADGMNGDDSKAIHDALVEHGAVAKYVGPRLGPVQSAARPAIEAEVTLETAPGVLFDAVVLPSGKAAIDALLKNGQAMDFIKDQYRHCKAILALEGASALVEAAGIPRQLPKGGADPGLLVVGGQDNATVVKAFIAAIARHRHFERQMDPPPV
jgi:catalase